MQTLPDSLRIGVIRGGPSSEYEVSLKTGGHVLEILSETHRPIDIFISKDGVWHMGGLEKSPEKILKNVDVVWNGLHGEFGEDGKLQEILSSHGVKYTGSEKYPSSITMNKWLTKEHLKSLGIRTPVYELVRQTDNLKEKAKEIFNSIPHPLIIKPVRGGSSLGIKIVDNYVDLYKALYEILSEESDALVEEFIKGKEATVGVIDNYRNQKVYSLPPIEIRHKSQDGYFDFDSKYSGEAEEICPGNFSQSEKKEIETLATLIHQHLGLRHYSRSDFIVSPKRGIYFLEVNSLPGLTKESLIPKALHSVGSSTKDFIHHILLLALNKI